MKIAIDIDNTICKTTEFYGKLAVLYDREVLRKNNKIDYTKGIPRSDSWSKEELKYFIVNYYNKNLLNIPVIQKAPFYIRMLKKNGAHITFITNRGTKEDDIAGEITPEYLAINKIPYDELITRANEKYKYLEDYDYFIDDSIKECTLAASNTKCHVIMMNTPQNSNFMDNRILKVDSWEGIYNSIMEWK